MIRRKHNGIRPQDIVILLKILSFQSKKWNLQDLVHGLNISLSEVSESLDRSKFSGLLDLSKKNVNRQGLHDLIVHSIQYIFPVKPGALVKGIPTAHSFPMFQKTFSSNIQYVWPDADGNIIGQEIEPLYRNQVYASQQDEKLYELLALIDLLRIGKKREVNFARKRLSEFILMA